MIILQINSAVNSGSTGRIAEDIGLLVKQSGNQSFIAAANTNHPSQSNVIRIGTEWDRNLHGFKTRIFDRHGFGSVNATRSLIDKINVIQPDIIHLHNIHGYYLNIRILFSFLKKLQKPVVWTLHDCWPFTGHCAHFERVNCYKWQTQCYACPLKFRYPASWLFDNSRLNYRNKKELFTGLQNLIIVTPSAWLTKLVKNSFLKEYPVHTLHNGIDLDVFKPVSTDEVKRKYSLPAKQIILGVANNWNQRKGLTDFIEISKKLNSNQHIILVGLSGTQQKQLPENITGILRTENTYELAALYSAADVFVNPTYVDNFPTTNIEALACGTPVITYNTGGSPEAIDEETGIVVNKGDWKVVSNTINELKKLNKKYCAEKCRTRAKHFFDKNVMYTGYLNYYKQML